MQTLAELRAREQEVEREWPWLQDALESVARARADRADAQALRVMQHQVMAVGKRRVELHLQMAALDGQPR